MSTLTLAPDGTLCAPASGVVRFRGPASLCGELEVYERNDALATIDDDVMRAPARGFVLRRLAADGARIERDEPLLVFRSA
jgi:hypothetical protein